MQSQVVKRHPLQKGSATTGIGNNAKKLPRVASRQHQCSACLKIFKYKRALEKHIAVCSRNLTIFVNMEVQENLLKDAVHFTEDISVKQEYDVFTPMEEAHHDRVLEALQITEFTATSPEEDLNTMDEEMIEVTKKYENSTLPYNAVHHQFIQENKETTKERVPVEASSIEGDSKSKAPAKSQQLQNSQNYQNDQRCDVCDDVFAEPFLLESHHKRHLEVKNQRSKQCYICFRYLINRRALARHLIVHTSRFKCDHCGNTFRDGCNLEVHIRRHLGIKPHQCKECKATFTTAVELKRHAPKHSKGFKCDLCERSFLKMTTLEEHRKVKHVSVSECNNYGSKLFNLEDQTTNEHIDNSNSPCDKLEIIDNAVENGAESIGGTDCPHICSNTNASDMACYSHLTGPSSGFKCEHCDQLFPSAADLKEHIMVHLHLNEETKKLNDNTDLYQEDHFQILDDAKEMPKEIIVVDVMSDEMKPKASEILTTNPAISSPNRENHNIQRRGPCDIKFTESSTDEDHGTFHLDIKKEQSNQCLICFKFYKNRYILRTHLVTHTSRFKCDLCGKTFQSSVTLEEHSRRHLVVKPFQCNECMAAYSTARSLKRHAQKHTSQYRCDNCSEAYHSSGQLEDHVRTCLGNKPHPAVSKGTDSVLMRHVSKQCTILKCEKNSALIEQRNKHQKTRPYKCTFCTGEFRFRNTFRNHKKQCRIHQHKLDRCKWNFPNNHKTESK